jgi:hypothetical protein
MAICLLPHIRGERARLSHSAGRRSRRPQTNHREQISEICDLSLRRDLRLNLVICRKIARGIGREIDPCGNAPGSV